MLLHRIPVPTASFHFVLFCCTLFRSTQVPGKLLEFFYPLRGPLHPRNLHPYRFNHRPHHTRWVRSHPHWQRQWLRSPVLETQSPYRLPRLSDPTPPPLRSLLQCLRKHRTVPMWKKMRVMRREISESRRRREHWLPWERVRSSNSRSDVLLSLSSFLLFTSHSLIKMEITVSAYWNSFFLFK